MEPLEQWKEYGSKLSRYLRTETHPLAIRLLRPGEAIPPKFRKPRVRTLLCTVINSARRTGQSIWATPDDLFCFGAAVMGLMNYDDRVWQEFCEEEATNMFHRMYTEKVESARAFMQNLPMIKKGTFDAIACSPLEFTRMEPDLVVVFGNPAQIYRLCVAILWKKEGTPVLEARIPCDDAMCTYGMAQAYLTQEPQFVLPGYGERVVSFAMDNEIAYVIPASKMPLVMEGLEKTQYSEGAFPVRYPIPYIIEKEAELAEVEDRAVRKLFGVKDKGVSKVFDTKGKGTSNK